MSLSTNCPKCGRPKATTMRTQQATPYAPGCSPADDVAYLVRKSQQQLAVNQLVTQIWNERMSDVPDAPAILFTNEQKQERERTFTANQQRTREPFEQIPAPPVLFAK